MAITSETRMSLVSRRARASSIFVWRQIINKRQTDSCLAMGHNGMSGTFGPSGMEPAFALCAGFCSHSLNPGTARARDDGREVAGGGIGIKSRDLEGARRKNFKELSS